MASSRFREALRLGSVNPDLDQVLHFGGKGGSPPSPDYTAAAQQQGVANIETARAQNIMGNPNVYTPYGSQTVSWGAPTGVASAPSFDETGYNKALQDWQASGGMTRVRGDPDSGAIWNMQPGAPIGAAPDRSAFMTSGAAGGEIQQPNVNINLSPEQQQLFDMEQRLKQQFGTLAEGGMGRVGEAFNKPFSFANADALQARAEEALLSRINPQLERFRQSREGSLIQQGHGRGGQAWGSLQESMGQQENDAVKQAVIDALRIRPQLLQEEMAIRNIPLNEVNALRTGAQVQLPQFQPFQGAGITPPPIMQGAQAQGQAGLNAFNAGVGQDNALMSGLFGLGAAALPFAFSDRRLKSDIVRIGTHPIGVGLYEYEIFGNREIGVMADEVLTVKSEAVAVHPSGFLMVNYGAID